ncbi:hypothetical protein HY469_04085 [Candidatus Roizmanbacteria bacterium]|nr:hypothetical protein [Candidatus Roizmanbacteria bacterium]
MEKINQPSSLSKRNPILSQQLSSFFNLQKKQFQQRKQTIDTRIAWAQNFTEQFLLIRTDRADDLQKPEIKEAGRLARAFFGKKTHHFAVTCMDGRIPLAVPMSHVPHVGGVMRTAGGDFEGFKDGVKEDSVIIDQTSHTAQAVKTLLTTKAEETIHYSFDSHRGCKARGDSETIAGSTAQDTGLSTDIRRKINLARGILKLRRELQNDGKKVADLYPQFFSYDPHDGTITQVLEAYVDQVGETGFSKDVLEKLQAEGKIVTTWQFLKDAEIIKNLREQVDHADFRNHFSESMLSNWRAITTLYEEGKGSVYTAILQRLSDAYKIAGWTIGEKHHIDKKMIAQTALENKAKVMLKNLVTRWSIAENENGHHWPYSEHNEHGIVLTEGGYGPFRSIDMFSVYSKGELLNHTYKAIEIVRMLRSGGLPDPLGEFSKPEDFVKAPVLIMNKAIIRGMSDHGWSVIQKIDMTNALTGINWDSEEIAYWRRNDIKNCIIQEFSKYPDALIHLTESTMFVDSVFELFDRLRSFMLDERFRPLVLSGSVMVVNLIVDEDRRAKIIVPFVI